MTKSSKICSFVNFIWKSFLDSRVYAFLERIVCYFADAYGKSKTREILVGKKDIEDDAGKSKVYGALSKAWSAFLGRSKSFFGFFEKNADGSLIKKLYFSFFKNGLRENAVYMTSFLCMIIFAVPHQFWANPFGLAFAVLLILIYAISASGTKSEILPGKDVKGVWLCMLAFGFCLVASTFISYDIVDSVRVLTFFITSYTLCFALYAAIRSEKGLDVVTGFMYAVLQFMSAIAVIQRILGIEADASLTDLELNKDMPGRVFSTLGNPNNFAEFLVLFMPFALAFALNRKKGAKRNACLFGMLLPLAAILLTYSRSGWIALAIAAVIFVYLYDKRLVPVFVILALAAIPVMPKHVLARILTIGNMKDSSSSYRLDIWSGCVKMLKDYWYTGVGLGTGGFAEIYPPYAVGTSGVAPHSHMHFMEMLVELGAAGFVSYVAMTFTIIKRSFISSSRRVSEKTRNVAVASASAMTGIVMIGCFEYCWFYPRVMFAFFVCAGIAMAAIRLAKNNTEDYRGKQRQTEKTKMEN
ncbi:MAG: O-antigen ligase family protein [Clostridia bacterium]|nr:O-antigen ligase family protein [Clostridia bacterium]